MGNRSLGVRIAAGVLGLVLLGSAFGYLTATSYRVGVGCTGGIDSVGDVQETACDRYETAPGSPMFHRGADFFYGWLALIGGIGFTTFALKGPNLFFRQPKG